MKAKYEFENDFTEGEWANSAYREYLRHYFAISALNGLLANEFLMNVPDDIANALGSDGLIATRVQSALNHADALLKELEKPQKTQQNEAR